jgi:hypothetical protein
LRAKDVSDISADFVADPFMVKEANHWYMFFEVMNSDSQKGEIGLALSTDGYKWKYDKIILTEPFNLSYPYVFKWQGEYYMLPESCAAYSVRLYKAVLFPTKWVFIKTILKGNYFDSSLLNYNGKWWLFTSDRDDILHLFSTDNLVGSWVEHPKSPVIFGNGHIARPGGRLLLFNGKIYRLTQDCKPSYGYQVRAFELTTLTDDDYDEREISENPILRPTGTGWNAERMHHLDAHERAADSWIACVDGVGSQIKFKLK